MRNLTYIIFLIGATTLNSCIATKPYVKEEIRDNYLFRLDSLQFDKEPNTSKIVWQEYFSDEILKNYIQTTLDNNFENQVALNNLSVFETRMKQRDLGHLPELNVTLDAQRQGLSKNSQFGGFINGSINTYRLNGALSWEADIWGKIKSQKLAAHILFDHSKTAQKLLKTTLIANVATTYYKLIEADERKRILQKSWSQRNKSLEVTKGLKDAGKGNAVEVNQSLAQLNQIEIDLEKINNEIFVLENALILLLGTKLNEVKRSNIEDLDINQMFEYGIDIDILNNRPDVLMAELEVRNAFEQKNIANASLYPSIKLTLNGGFESTKLTEFITGASFVNTLAGGLTAPIFNRGRLKAEKKIAQNQLDQKSIQFRNKLFNAGIEVSRVLKEHQTIQSNVDKSAKQEAILESAYLDALELFKAGFGNYLNVILIQDNLLNAQLSNVTLLSQQFQNEAKLYRALGGD